MKNDINLLERRKNRIGILKYQKLRILRIIAVSLLFLVSTFSVILFLLISFSPLPQLKKQETQALFALSQYHPEMAKLYIVNERAKTIAAVLSKRKSFDQTITAIQSKLPAGVEVDALNIDQGHASLSVSSKSMELIDTFINNLLTSVQSGKDFSQVTLTSLSIDSQKNVFLLTVSLITLGSGGK